ncbi:hypothetical protein I4U23_004249 [Adineta vaga]|nr:hypothetical protein I4U23_004249 [Adineta vaga]
MSKKQFFTASFVPKPTTRKRWNQVIPIKHERHPRKIRKRSISNENKVSSYGSSPLFENINSSLNMPNTEISSFHQEQFETNDTSHASLATSDRPLQFNNFTMYNDGVHQRIRHLEYSWIVTTFWLTVVSLTVLLIAIYLLLILIKNPIMTASTITTISVTTQTTTTTATTTTATTTATPTKQSYYCSGVSPYSLWITGPYGDIMMNINTSQCNFNSTPVYFTSLGGDMAHYGAGGYTAIYSPTKNSFSVFIAPIISYTFAIVQNYTHFYRWNVNWVDVNLQTVTDLVHKQFDLHVNPERESKVYATLYAFDILHRRANEYTQLSEASRTRISQRLIILCDTAETIDPPDCPELMIDNNDTTMILFQKINRYLFHELDSILETHIHAEMSHVSTMPTSSSSSSSSFELPLPPIEWAVNLVEELDYTNYLTLQPRPSLIEWIQTIIDKHYNPSNLTLYLCSGWNAVIARYNEVIMAPIGSSRRTQLLDAFIDRLRNTMCYPVRVSILSANLN